jgi:ribose 1,5-bisphosphokinase PhnN
MEQGFSMQRTGGRSRGRENNEAKEQRKQRSKPTLMDDQRLRVVNSKGNHLFVATALIPGSL